MRRICALAVLQIVALFLVAQARGETIISALSEDEVSITSNFTGERLTVFGVVRRDAGSIGRAGADAVAVILEGPRSTVQARRKARVAGIWINTRGERFENVPGYYAVHLSGTLPSLTSERQLAARGIGPANLPELVAGESDAEAFAEALVRLRSEDGLFRVRENDVQFLTNRVFKTTFFLPAHVPLGDYKVRTLLFQDGVFLGERVDPLHIRKRGMSARVAGFAADNRLLYGLASVALALFTGWLASLVFGRDR